MKPLALLLVLGLLAVAPVADRVEAQRGRPGQVQKVERYEVTAGITEALRTLSTDPEASLRVLRDLDRRFPNNERVLTRVGYVHQVMGSVDSAEYYYRHALRVDKSSLEAGKSLGALLLASERDREALGVFNKLLEDNGHSLGAYRTVGTALRDSGRYQEALDVYRDGRDRGQGNSVLTLEIAAIQKTMGNLIAALDEYLSYIGDNERNYRFIRTKLLELIRDADGPQREQLIAGMEERMSRGQTKTFALMDILSAHYLEIGLLEKSLDMALRADGQKGSDGAILLTLAEQILATAPTRARTEKQRYLELGIRALDAFAGNHPRARGTDRARYMLATIMAEFGSGAVPGLASDSRREYLERAVDTFSEIPRSYPSSEYAELSYLDRGQILLHMLKRPEEALKVYKTGAINAREQGIVFAERIADLYLGLERYDDADAYFAGLARSGTPDVMRAGEYYQGLCLVFKGDYAAGRDALSAIAGSDPASPYTNNALEIAWIVEEALQYESASLDAYVGALRAELVGDTAAVIAHLNDIVERPVYETLRPRALFWLGTTLYQTGELEKAVATLERFLDEYPDEDLRPDVHREIATIYEYGYEKYEQALRTYESVLISYPEYAFLDEVRKDVRRLRYIVEGEEYEQ